MSRMIPAVLSAVLLGCVTTYTPPPDAAGLYSKVFAKMIQEYDSMPEQFDDPVGRTYCLAFQHGPGAPYRRFDHQFMSRFAQTPHVRSADYCVSRPGRWMVVSSIQKTNEGVAEVWSLSKVTSRTGYSTCLNPAERDGSDWQIGPCKDGRIYD